MHITQLKAFGHYSKDWKSGVLQSQKTMINQCLNMILQKKVRNHSLPWTNAVGEKNGNYLQAAKNDRQNKSEKKIQNS